MAKSMQLFEPEAHARDVLAQIPQIGWRERQTARFWGEKARANLAQARRKE
jgi:hypothetical protein